MEPLGGGVVGFHKHLCFLVDIPIKYRYMPISIRGKQPIIIARHGGSSDIKLPLDCILLCDSVPIDCGRVVRYSPAYLFAVQSVVSFKCTHI